MPVKTSKSYFLTLLIATTFLLQTSASFAAKGGRWANTSGDGEEVVAPKLRGKKVKDSSEEQAPVDETPTDTTAPVLTIPATITVEAASAAGTVVEYQASANDNTDGQIDINCAPATGSLFALGSTTISCNAADQAGNTSQSSFSINVVDSTAPMITAPADIEIVGDADTPIAVTFNVSATDLVDNDVAVYCLPSSGELFLPGETIVECSAQDSKGNISDSSFSVRIVENVIAPEPVVPDTYAITLDWVSPSTRTDGSTIYQHEISSYEIFYSTSEAMTNGTLLSVAAFDNNGNHINKTTIESISAGQYYVAISAVDLAGNPSDFSAPIPLIIE